MTINCYLYVQHRNLRCFYLVQNQFFQGKVSKTINLNTNYLFLFKDHSDKYQIMLMARQMFPVKSNFFMECYENAMIAPNGYLLVDCKARTRDHLRLETGSLSGLPVVYVPKNK